MAAEFCSSQASFTSKPMFRQQSGRMHCDASVHFYSRPQREICTYGALGQSLTMTGASTKQAKRPLLKFLRANLDSLKPRDRSIAEYILANAEQILALTFVEMRANSGACNDAILGFCRRCGLKGYRDLKITLARELGRSDRPWTFLNIYTNLRR
jgi:hypothetical protein